MRIACVGKGGSGKTTVAALFTQLVAKRMPVLAVDADLNVHLPPLIGAPSIPREHHLSYPAVATKLKTHLRGTNDRIRRLEEFRKTTPPGDGSKIVRLRDPHDAFLADSSTATGSGARLLVVGSYTAEGIGASCYHNDLALLENLLTHLDDRGGVLVVDMVAGVDAFASSLFMQFDLFVLVVEPTRLGVEVYHQYAALSEAAGTQDALVVVGNKIHDDADRAFLREHIPASRLVGVLENSEKVRRMNRDGGVLRPDLLSAEGGIVLESIATRLAARETHPNARLAHLHDLHRRYVAQDFIRDRFGDLTSQIDPAFSFDGYEH